MNDVETLSDHDLLIRLDTKVDQFINNQADHEARLRVLKSNQDEMHGSIRALKAIISVVGVIAALASAIGTWELLKK